MTDVPESSSSMGAKYKVIYTRLFDALKTGEYEAGGKLPSENELAKQFSASRPTIGRALAQLQREGHVERRAGSGTFVCLPERSDNLVFGLLIPELGVTEIFEPICRGISTARVGGRHDLLWGPTFSPAATEEAQAEELCRYYIQRGVTGVFFAPMELTPEKDAVNRRITAALDEACIPIVLLDRDICDFPRRSRYDLVGIDNRRAGFLITEHVLNAGAKRVVFLGRPNSAPTVRTRAMGYADAIREQRNPSMGEFVKSADPTDLAAMRDIMDRIQPDGFVCANDFTAAQLMTSLNSLAIRVPSQIKVAGMDDIKYAQLLQTPLTTIHQPCMELGALALHAMLERARHPQMPARDFIVSFELIVRESTR